MTKYLVFLIYIVSLSVIDAARILGIFSMPSISHQVVFRAITQELARRGHEVVVITTDPAFPKGQAPANLTEIDIHDISYNYLRNELLQELVAIYEYGKEISWTDFEKTSRIFFRVMEVQAKSKPVQKLIQENRKFDILLIESFARASIAYSHFFKAPVIFVSSFGPTVENLELFGAPVHPILYPTSLRTSLYNLTLWQKFQEYYYHALYKLSLERRNERLDDELVQKMFGPDIPSVAELNKNIDMLLLNVHPIWMDNLPVPPGIICVGGIHQTPTKELPQDLKRYLDSSVNGVIYVSFGTNVHPFSFTPERIKVITEAISELPYDVLFKWNGDELPGRTENIKTSKWFPQSDLIKHPKVKGFLMQGGLQSTDEAITAGVPLVCIPMLGDQWYNAEKYVKFKIGIKLDLKTLTKPELKNAIETIVSDKSYRENIIKLRNIMYDQPQSPLERAVWWIEHALRHGGARHLRAPAANMSWAEYYELDLVLILLACLLISTIICVFTVISIYRYLTKYFSYNIKVKKT